MAGHSKWANIKYKKERADAQKGKIFSRIAKEIISSVKLGGADPKSNPRLRLAILKAKEANFPAESIDRNIKKASSEGDNLETILYEIYAHGGIGMLVEAMTDNKNRTASDMRIATNKKGGTIAQPGAVAYNFDRKGIILIENKAIEEDALFQIMIDAGAEDFEASESGFVITTDPVQLYAVKEELDRRGVLSTEVEISMIPKTSLTCEGEALEMNLALIDWLEGLDDVNAVYHNMDL